MPSMFTGLPNLRRGRCRRELTGRKRFVPCRLKGGHAGRCKPVKGAGW